VPDYNNVEVFVSRLIHAGLLVIDPTVTTALRGELTDVLARTVQRSFRRATGVTRSAAEQIERARYAALLLMRGVPIVDAAHEAGYFDQPHLTRSFKRIGLTPSDVRRHGSLQLPRNSTICAQACHAASTTEWARCTSGKAATFMRLAWRH
jgi:AraC-like DNA-binding protein